MLRCSWICSSFLEKAKEKRFPKSKLLYVKIKQPENAITNEGNHTCSDFHVYRIRDFLKFT